eukprot:gene6233-biopygen7144
MDYSIGDRVEVLLEQKLFTAEVRAVYNTGKVDVVYDADASAGKPCSMEGCTTKTKARGLCDTHGANGKCVQLGCVTNALKRGGHCRKHSKKVACAHPNCSTSLVPGKGVCVKHGAYGICTAWGCTTNAASGKIGHCMKHFKDKATCSTSDCSNRVVARGLCIPHGARGFCSTGGCDSGAIKDGLCFKHGAKGFCTFNDCTTAAKARGLCMVLTAGARLMDAPPRQHEGLSIASNTAAGRRRSRAPWRAAPPPLIAKASVVNMGGGKDECKMAGCTNHSYGFLKTCTTHGRRGYCQHPSGCITATTKYGANCTEHTKE